MKRETDIFKSYIIGSLMSENDLIDASFQWVILCHRLALGQTFDAIIKNEVKAPLQKLLNEIQKANNVDIIASFRPLFDSSGSASKSHVCAKVFIPPSMAL
jgi:hypothetical protein